MVRSGFQFANPILERVSFVTNNKFDSDKFEGIDIESQTSVEMHEENTAKVSLNVIVGSSEDNQPFNIDIVMSAKFRWRDTIDIAKRTGATIISTAEIANMAESQGLNAHGMNIGGKFNFEFGSVKVTQAIHSAGIEGGLACGFIIDFY